MKMVVTISPHGNAPGFSASSVVVPLTCCRDGLSVALSRDFICIVGNLSTSQRAAVAVEMLPFLEEEAKGRQGARTDIATNSEQSSGRSAEKASESVNVGEAIVYEAKSIKEAAPDVFERVRSGELTIHAVTLAVQKEQARELAATIVVPSLSTGRLLSILRGRLRARVKKQHARRPSNKVYLDSRNSPWPIVRNSVRRYLSLISPYSQSYQ